MKALKYSSKICCLLCLFFFLQASSWFPKVFTGVQVLDNALYAFDIQSQTISGARQVINEIAYSFNLTNVMINSLHQQGYTYSQIYYLGLLSQQSGRSIDSILTTKNSQGIGWGQLAHKLGIHPSVLNKERVALKKKYKNKKSTPTSPSLTLKQTRSNPGKGNSNKYKVKGNSQGKGKGKNK